MSTDGRRTARADIHTRRSPRAPRGTTRCRVLLLESHDDTRDLYAEFLRYAGFAVVPASASDDALKHVGSVDAVVTGIAVVGSFNGIEFVQRVRASRATARVPIIVVTAHVLPVHRAQAIAAGADVFLAKPCLPHLLARQVRRTVASRRLRAPCPLRAPVAPPRQTRAS